VQTYLFANMNSKFLKGPHLMRIFTQQENEMSIKKIATATVLGVALIGTTLVAPAPANATHKIGHFAAGVGLGLLLGGAVRRPVYQAPPPVYVAPPAYGGLPPAHYNWCINRYRSYHPASNTWQPYNGPRRQCLSNWWR
jgi:hypothetical protein